MKEITVLGATGMLGSAVTKHFLEQGYLVKALTRDVQRAKTLFPDAAVSYFDALQSQMFDVRMSDNVFNAIGVIKPRFSKDSLNSIKINATFPHELARFCNTMGVQLIHPSTDCVFAPYTTRPLTEDTYTDAHDAYGQSKALGEPVDDAMVLRVSIIGEEAGTKYSLVEWCKSNAGKDVTGYMNHTWNGITTKHYGKVLQQIFEQGLYTYGLFHVLPKDSVTKAQLVSMISTHLNLHMGVQYVNAPEPVNRVLSTNKPHLNTLLNVPTIKEMVDAL